MEKSATHSDSLGNSEELMEIPSFWLGFIFLQTRVIFACLQFSRVAWYLLNLVSVFPGLFSNVAILPPICECILSKFIAGIYLQL